MQSLRTTQLSHLKWLCSIYLLNTRAKSLFQIFKSVSCSRILSPHSYSIWWRRMQKRGVRKVSVTSRARMQVKGPHFASNGQRAHRLIHNSQLTFCRVRHRHTSHSYGLAQNVLERQPRRHCPGGQSFPFIEINDYTLIRCSDQAVGYADDDVGFCLWHPFDVWSTIIAFVWCTPRWIPEAGALVCTLKMQQIHYYTMWVRCSVGSGDRTSVSHANLWSVVRLNHGRASWIVMAAIIWLVSACRSDGHLQSVSKTVFHH